MASHQIRIEPIAASASTNTDKALMTVPEHAQLHDIALAFDSALSVGAAAVVADLSDYRVGVGSSIGGMGQASLPASSSWPVAEPLPLGGGAGVLVAMNDTLYFRWAQGTTGVAFPGGVLRVTAGPRYAPGPWRPRTQVHVPATAAATGRTPYALIAVDEPCRIMGAYFVPDTAFTPSQDIILGLTAYRNQGVQAGGDQSLGFGLVQANKPVNAGELIAFGGIEAEQPVAPGDTIVLTYTQGASTQALPSGHVVILLSDALDARDVRPSLVAHSRYPGFSSSAGSRQEQILSVVEQHSYLTALHVALDATATLTNAANLFINLRKHRGTTVGGDGTLGTFALGAGQVLTQGYPLHGQVAYPILELEPGDVIYAAYVQGASGQALGAGAITLDVEESPGTGEGISRPNPSRPAQGYGGGYTRPNPHLPTGHYGGGYERNNPHRPTDGYGGYERNNPYTPGGH